MEKEKPGIIFVENLEIHAVKQPEGQYSIGSKPIDVFKRLVTPIYNTGRNITADNWFTDVELVSYLKEKNVYFVGVKRRPEMSSMFGFSNDATIVSYVRKKART